MRAAIATSLMLLTVALTGCIGGLDADDDLEQTRLADEGLELVDIGTLTDVTNDDPTLAAHADATLPTVNDPTQNLAVDQVPEHWDPPAPAEVPASIEGIVHEATALDDDNRGAGFGLFGSIVVMPSFAHATSVFDISDPLNPTHVADLDEGHDQVPSDEHDIVPHRDAHPLAFPDGRLYFAFASDYGVIPIWNLTNPQQPQLVTQIEPDRGSHNVEIVPGTPYLYNSGSAGGGQGSQATGGQESTEIYDLSDPHDPELVTEFENGYSCHDIKFGIWADQDKHRAYCAGIEVTQIWDIQDPTNPEVIVDVPVHHGNPALPSLAVSSGMFSHLAMPNQDGTILIVGDENGGGVAPACDAHVDAGGTTLSGPSGNLWFYDITDEENPQLEGWISPTHHYTYNPPHNDRPTEINGAPVPSGCTAHFGHLLPEDDKVAMGFYGAGVLIVDFSDPANPQITDQWYDAEEPGTNVWDVWYYQGYLITGDLIRTMDVFTLE